MSPPFSCPVSHSYLSSVHEPPKQAEGIAADNACLGHVATACARGEDLDTALMMARGMLAKGHNVSRTYNNIMLAIVNGQAFKSRQRYSSTAVPPCRNNDAREII